MDLGVNLISNTLNQCRQLNIIIVILKVQICIEQVKQKFDNILVWSQLRIWCVDQFVEDKMKYLTQ